jgi:hypothetical protein
MTGSFYNLFSAEASWNVMAHAQKPDFVFRRNGRVHLNRPVGASVQSTTGSRGARTSGSNAGYTMFRGSVKSTGYPLHSPVSPFTSSPVRHRVPSHFNWSLLPEWLAQHTYIISITSLHNSDWCLYPERCVYCSVRAEFWNTLDVTHSLWTLDRYYVNYQ